MKSLKLPLQARKLKSSNEAKRQTYRHIAIVKRQRETVSIYQWTKDVQCTQIHIFYHIVHVETTNILFVFSTIRLLFYQ